MGVVANKSDEKVVAERKLYTGIANAKVIAINPSTEGLKKLGYSHEANYTSKDDDGNDQIRLDFYLANETFPKDQRPPKVSFFLTNKPRTRQDGGGYEWIDKTGRTAWTPRDSEDPESVPDLDWFDKESARKAYDGEGRLINFLKAWLNVKPNDECNLDNIEQLFEEKYDEINILYQSFKNNEVRVMFTVHDDQYQHVYTNYFDRATNSKFNYWKKHIDKQESAGYPIRDEYSLDFKEFQASLPDEDSVTTGNGQESKNSDNSESPF